MKQNLNENKHKMKKILTLDGGGSKGVFTLGILFELEQKVSKNLYEYFDLIYGTSTGSIIGSLIALGKTISEIKKYYFEYVPFIMRQKNAGAKSKALQNLGDKIYGDRTFEDFKTKIGIVGLNAKEKKPMIFKNTVNLAYKGKSTFKPGFGFTISEAVQASCSAYPIFNKKELENDIKGKFTVIDGGFVANNPTLYAINDAVLSLNSDYSDLCVISVGTGDFIEKNFGFMHKLIKDTKYYQLFQTTLAASSETNNQLVKIIYPNVNVIRINNHSTEKEYATNFVEQDLEMLEKLFDFGRQTFTKLDIDIC